MPGGGIAIVCARGKKAKACSKCGWAADLLCDFPTSDRHNYPRRGIQFRTCSKVICDACAVEELDSHYCPDHFDGPTRSIRWAEVTPIYERVNFTKD